MPKPNLRAVNVEVEHPRDRARREVKRFRLDREKEKLPITNQSTGAANLFVDDVLKRTERTLMEAPRSRYKPNPLIVMLMIVIFVSGAAMGVAYVVPRVARAIVEALR